MEGLLGTATVRRTRLTATDMQRVTDSLMTFARFVDTNATARRLFGQRPSQFVVYVLTGPLSRVADTTTMDHFYQQLAHSNVSVSKDILEEAARLRRYRTTPLPLRGVTMAGNPLDLAQWRGKVVAIDFWATTCGPCIAEMPKFKALYDRYHAQGFEMVGIVSPRPEANDRALVLQILAQRHIPWPQLYGSPLKNVLLPDHALPYMLVVDPQGHIVTSVSGPGVTADELEPVLRRLLKQRTRYSSTKRPFFFRFHRYEVTPLRPSEFLQALRPQSHTSRKRHHERG